MRAFYRHAELLLELGRAAGVVNVAMGQQDLLDLQAELADSGLDAIEVAAGIHHGALLAVLVPEQRTVLLERRDGDDGSFQGHRRAFAAAGAASLADLAPAVIRPVSVSRARAGSCAGR